MAKDASDAGLEKIKRAPEIARPCEKCPDRKRQHAKPGDAFQPLGQHRGEPREADREAEPNGKISKRFPKPRRHGHVIGGFPLRPNGPGLVNAV